MESIRVKSINARSAKAKYIEVKPIKGVYMGKAKMKRTETKAIETTRRRSKQVPDSTVLSDNDINALAPQLVELLEGRVSGIFGDRLQVTLCDHDPLQPDADAGEA